MTTTENSHIDPTEAPPVPDANTQEPAVAPDAVQDDAVYSGQPAGAATEDAARSDSVPSADQLSTDSDSALQTEAAVEIPDDVVELTVERPAPIADEVLLASVDIARAALLEVTPAETIGEPVGHAAEDDHVLSLFFDSKLRGYPGWHWTVTLARAGGDDTVSVLETELMPGENALLAPEWVPWSERLADYQAGQEVAESEARALAEAAAVLDESDDEDDEDDDVFSILHAGDVDGVDVDEIDDSDDDDDDDEDDESDDDDESEEDDETDDDADYDESEGLDRSY